MVLNYIICIFIKNEIVDRNVRLMNLSKY